MFVRKVARLDFARSSLILRITNYFTIRGVVASYIVSINSIADRPSLYIVLCCVVLCCVVLCCVVLCCVVLCCVVLCCVVLCCVVLCCVVLRCFMLPAVLCCVQTSKGSNTLLLFFILCTYQSQTKLKDPE